MQLQLVGMLGADVSMTPERSRERTVWLQRRHYRSMRGAAVAYSIGLATCRLTFWRGAAAVAFVLLKKAACGVAKTGADLTAMGLLWSLVPANRDWRLIFMLRAVIVDAIAFCDGIGLLES